MRNYRGIRLVMRNIGERKRCFAQEDRPQLAQGTPANSAALHAHLGARGQQVRGCLFRVLAAEGKSRSDERVGSAARAELRDGQPLLTLQGAERGQGGALTAGEVVGASGDEVGEALGERRGAGECAAFLQGEGR